MRRSSPAVIIIMALLFLSGCAHKNQNTYGYEEVGKSSAISFGTILSVREIDITGQNTGVGAVAGAAAGAGIGSQIGQGGGNAAAVAGIAVAGAIAGAIAEQAIANRKGIEYTVILQTGLALTIVQEIAEGEKAFSVGERVMVQNSGGYQRVLSAQNLPTEVKRPKGIKLVD